MKIGVAGTGAVGGYFGALLKKAGNEVVFLARGKNYHAMKEKGLIIEGEQEWFKVEGVFTDQYEALSDIDLLLFSVKSTATNEVAEKLLPILKQDCLILTLQNGVDNEETLSAIFGKKRVLSAASYIQAILKEPGVVKQIEHKPFLVIGALDESLTEKVKKISELFQSSNIDTRLSADVLEIKWKKLFWNVTFNPLTALLEIKVGEIYNNEGLYETAVTICKEAIAVSRSLGVAVQEDFYRKIMAQGKVAKNHQTSMLQDKLAGKPMEIESICGYIIQKGKEQEVSVPVLETIYHLLKYQDCKRIN